LGIFSENNLTTITVPEIVETKNGSHIVIRGASIELIALLESGDLDYAFDYETVIQQHGLKAIHLPDQINLGSEELNDLYQTVEVNLDFQRFASVKPVFRGERISYGITIPSNAPNPKAAELLLEFLLSLKGRAIMQADHHPVFNPAIGVEYTNIPASLQPLCMQGDLP
jgi:molybdate/tungstate transport system substrate-binding protein